MKVRIGHVLVIAIVFCSAQLRAQDLKTKISVGYGIITVPANENLSIAGGVFNSIISNQQTSTTSTGALGIQVDRDLTERFSVGANLIYQGIEKDITGTNYKENQQYTYITILPSGTYSYVHKPGFDFYGRVGLGVSFKKAESTIVNQGVTTSADANKTDFAYQISPIGIRAGKKFFFKAEAGYGYMGVLSIGIGYRF